MTLKQLLRIKHLCNLDRELTILEVSEYLKYEKLILNSTTIDFDTSIDIIIQESIEQILDKKIDEVLDDT